MKILSLLMAAALGMTASIASAQTQGAGGAPPADATTSTSPAMPSSTLSPPAAAETTPPVTAENKIDLTSEPGPPEDPRAARQEAVNALHWARTEGCRDDPSPRECLRRAQDDYRAALDRLGASDTRGTMSASGTSASPDGNAPRSDRH